MGLKEKFQEYQEAAKKRNAAVREKLEEAHQNALPPMTPERQALLDCWGRAEVMLPKIQEALNTAEGVGTMVRAMINEAIAIMGPRARKSITEADSDNIKLALGLLAYISAPIATYTEAERARRTHRTNAKREDDTGADSMLPVSVDSGTRREGGTELAGVSGVSSVAAHDETRPAPTDDIPSGHTRTIEPSGAESLFLVDMEKEEYHAVRG